MSRFLYVMFFLASIAQDFVLAEMENVTSSGGAQKKVVSKNPSDSDEELIGKPSGGAEADVSERFDNFIKYLKAHPNMEEALSRINSGEDTQRKPDDTNAPLVSSFVNGNAVVGTGNLVCIKNGGSIKGAAETSLLGKNVLKNKLVKRIVAQLKSKGKNEEILTIDSGKYSAMVYGKNALFSFQDKESRSKDDFFCYITYSKQK